MLLSISTFPIPVPEPHPAVKWALSQHFNDEEIDCTTAVVLKILDGKCKMAEGEKRAIIEIYKIKKTNGGILFGDSVHTLIQQALQQSVIPLSKSIHELRVEAEKKIPKPSMKRYKAMLREGLFG